jgi:hypothetical protein
MGFLTIYFKIEWHGGGLAENGMNDFNDQRFSSINRTTRPAGVRIGLIILYALTLVSFSYFVLGPLGGRLEKSLPRLAALGLVTLIGAAILKVVLPQRSWTISMIATLLGVGAVYQVASYIPQVSTYPFSIGWSEASRYYFASLFFSKQVYGLQTALSVLHPSRYLMQSLPFLIPDVPMWVHRLWQVILWLVFTGLAAGLLERRLQIPGKGEKWLFFIWAALFLFQGPVYYHLLVMLILVLWGFDPKSFWKTMAFVLVASLWAGISRINWAPVPGMLAAALYFLCGRVEKKSYLGYLIPPASWTLAGSGAALVVQKFYERFSGNPAYEFGSSFTSDLLWYRLLPSHTYMMGVLPAAFLASAAVLLIAGLKLLPCWRQYHPIRLLGLAAILLVLFVGGVVVSVKIGGGSNLHNLDAYLSLLLVITSYIYYGKFEPDNQGQAEPINPSHPMLMSGSAQAGLFILAALAPVAFTVTVGGPLPTYDFKTAYNNLAQIKQTIEQSVSIGGQVLFISERQLLTFHYINAPLFPDDELVFLMEMAMANNKPYLDAFYNDLKEHKFAIIVSHPVSTNFQGGEHVFGEENDAWVRGVSKPLLCFYKPAMQFPKVNLILYVPKTGSGNCR